MDKIINNRDITNGIITPIYLERDSDYKIIGVTDTYIDISYKRKETEAKILSNLYPYKFEYFKNKVSSIEGAIQSLKYKDENIRKLCYEYSGVDAYHLRGMDPYKWQNDGILYTPIGTINRYSEQYQDFIDELYFSVFQNPLYKKNLAGSKNKMLDHIVGEDNMNYTTLTRTEYISRLYALRYCINNQIDKKDDVMKVLKKVRIELKK